VNSELVDCDVQASPVAAGSCSPPVSGSPGAAVQNAPAAWANLPAGFVSAPAFAAPASATAGPGAWISPAVGRWWVLHTRARNEKRVAAALAEGRVQHYLPLVNVRHTYTKWKVSFKVPLFPGYVFLCGDHSDCDKARRTNRVARILPVADQDKMRGELRHICQVVEAGDSVELFPAIQVGRRCRIAGGPLKGVEGVVVRQGHRYRMYLSVSTLGQSATVEVDAALLESAD